MFLGRLFLDPRYEPAVLSGSGGWVGSGLRLDAIVSI